MKGRTQRCEGPCARAAAAVQLGKVDITYTRGHPRRLLSQELGSGAIRFASAGPTAGTESGDVAFFGD